MGKFICNSISPVSGTELRSSDGSKLYVGSKSADLPSNASKFRCVSKMVMAEYGNAVVLDLEIKRKMVVTIEKMRSDCTSVLFSCSAKDQKSIKATQLLLPKLR